jgi:hypothetical protein
MITPMRPSAQKVSVKKAKEEPKETKYTELINLGIVKKFDMDAVLDQANVTLGDCHLPRGKFSNLTI